MSAKNILWMTLGAAGLGAAAYYMNDSRAAATSQAEASALVPGLRATLNDVDRLALTTPDGPLTFSKDGDAWTIVERGDYPADGGKIGTFLLAIEDSKRLEQKTSKPERYASLGLDPDAEDSPTTRVVAQAGAQTAFDLWIGNRRGTGAGDAYYARLDGESSTWVAGGDLEVSNTLADWVETALVDIDRERMFAVSIEHPDGDPVQATRATGEEDVERMALMNIPEGQELQSEWVTSRFDSGLASLKFDDVESAAGAEFAEDEAVSATYWTEHGLAVTLLTVPKDGGGLRAKISASYDPEGAPSLVVGPVVQEMPKVDLMDEDGEGEAGAAEDEDAPPTPEELQAEADAINTITEGWIYSLPEYKSQALRPRMDELVKAIETASNEESMGETNLPNGLNSDLNGILPGLNGELDSMDGVLDQTLEELEKSQDKAMDSLNEMTGAVKSTVEGAPEGAMKKVESAADGAMKKVEGAADDAMKKVEGAADDVMKKVEGAADDAMKKVEGAADDAKKKVEGAADDAKKNVEEPTRIWKKDGADT